MPRNKMFFTSEKKSIDEENRTVEFVISTNSYDRYKDRVKPSGCKSDAYMRNPVVLIDHSYKAENVVATSIDISIEEDYITSIAKFPKEGISEKSDMVFEKLKAGLLNAVSIGFKPLKYMRNEAGGYDIEEWELLEYSIVAVPANGEALQVGKSYEELDEAIKKALKSYFEEASQSDVDIEKIAEEIAKEMGVND